MHCCKDSTSGGLSRLRSKLSRVEDAQDETRRSIDQVDDQVKEVERGIKKDTNTLKKAEQKLTSKALSLTGKALGLVGDIARSESDSVKDGENLEAEMAEETSTFEDMVTKDTASAIDKFTGLQIRALKFQSSSLKFPRARTCELHRTFFQQFSKIIKKCCILEKSRKNLAKF